MKHFVIFPCLLKLLYNFYFPDLHQAKIMRKHSAHQRKFVRFIPNTGNPGVLLVVGLTLKSIMRLKEPHKVYGKRIIALYDSGN